MPSRVLSYLQYMFSSLAISTVTSHIFLSDVHVG